MNAWPSGDRRNLLQLNGESGVNRPRHPFLLRSMPSQAQNSLHVKRISGIDCLVVSGAGLPCRISRRRFSRPRCSPSAVCWSVSTLGELDARASQSMISELEGKMVYTVPFFGGSSLMRRLLIDPE